MDRAPADEWWVDLPQERRAEIARRQNVLGDDRALCYLWWPNLRADQVIEIWKEEADG